VFVGTLEKKKGVPVTKPPGNLEPQITVDEAAVMAEDDADTWEVVKEIFTESWEQEPKYLLAPNKFCWVNKGGEPLATEIELYDWEVKPMRHATLAGDEVPSYANEKELEPYTSKT